MHSDQSVRHIALTCPHCGKHYAKVPYDAIKKHQFAFCKQCNTKFRVEPSVLEEALQQAARAIAVQNLEASESLSQHSEHTPARADAHEPESALSAQMPDTQTIHGLQDILQQAAGAAQDLLPEPPAAGEVHDHGMLTQLADAQQIETEDQPSIESSFEQKINKLAATIDETFGQPQEVIPPVYTGESAVENIFGDTSIDTTQAEQIPEPQQEYLTPSSAANMQELERIHSEDLTQYQPGETPVEKASEQDIFEVSLIQDQHADASWEIEAGQEPFEEPLVEDRFIAAFAETAFEEDPLEKVACEDQPVDTARKIEAGQEPFEEPLVEDKLVAASTETDFSEETFDDALIEDQSQKPFEQDANDAIEAQEKNPVFAQAKELQNAAHNGFVASPDDSGSNRDVSAMLKDMMLPKAAIEEGTEQFVLFSLGEQMFAAPIANVFELSLPPDLIMVPNTPQWMLGVANLRGEIMSIVDLRGFLNMEQESYKKSSRMIIAQTLDKEMMVGLIVDRINGIKYFSIDEIQPFQQQSPRQAEAYLQGAFAHEDTMATFLDFEQLLQSAKMRQFQ